MNSEPLSVLYRIRDNTDNGREFSSPREIEYRETITCKRTSVFYCDAGSPYETVSFYHGEEVLHKLGCTPVAASDIMLKPALLKK